MLGHEEAAARDMKIIVFRLLDQLYGVEVNQVKSIERLESITQMPGTPKFVKGVVHLRGAVVPIIDLKDRLDLGNDIPTDQTRIIIVYAAGLEVGLIVDSADDVIDILKSAIQPPPQVISRVHANYLQGVVKWSNHLLILLNLENILEADEIVQISAVEGLI